MSLNLPPIELASDWVPPPTRKISSDVLPSQSAKDMSLSESLSELLPTMPPGGVIAKAKECWGDLVAEIDKLRKREAEIVGSMQEVLRKKHLEEERALLAAPVVSEEDKHALLEEVPAPSVPVVDPRSTIYEASVDSPQSLDKVEYLKEELRLLSRLHKREDCSAWLEQGQRSTCTEEDVAAWERQKGVELPFEMREVLKMCGGRMRFAENQVYSQSYSPFLSLLSVENFGWAEIWGKEEEPEEDQLYDDDEIVRILLEEFQAGHEYEDEFVVEQLRGQRQCEDAGDGEERPCRVLMVGAPLERVDRSGNRMNSRMFLNIRPEIVDGELKFVGDGLLYRLDSVGDDGDSELIRVGTAFDWIEDCFWEEVEQRLNKGDPGKLIAQRYPQVLLREAANRAAGSIMVVSPPPSLADDADSEGTDVSSHCSKRRRHTVDELLDDDEEDDL